jgi:hypothetical protein
MNGTFPAQAGSFPSFDGDQLHKFGLDVRVDADNDPHTGVLADNGSEWMTAYGMGDDNGLIHTNYISFSTGPTGTETPELARYQDTIFTDQTQFGGPGYNYFIIALPLAPLRLSKGQEITINAWVEMSSDKFDHASFDVLCPPSMTYSKNTLSCPVRIKLGTQAIIQ